MILKTKKDVKRVLTATMNTLNVVTGICGLSLSKKGLDLYSVSDLGQQNELVTMVAVGLGVLGVIAAVITLGGGYWLNSGSNHFKIKMCAVLGFIALAMASLRGVFPNIENSVNKSILQAMQSYHKEEPATATGRHLVDGLQAKFNCCGYFGIDDFSKTSNLPASCCTSGRLIEGKCTRNRARKVPCMTRINARLETDAHWLKTLSFVTSCVMNGLVLILSVIIIMYKDHVPLSDKIKWHY